MRNQKPPVTIAELKRQGSAAFADAKKAIAKSHQIVLEAMRGQAELGFAIAEYKEMGRLEFVSDLPQVRRWEEGRVARETAYLLTLGERLPPPPKPAIQLKLPSNKGDAPRVGGLSRER